MKTFNLSQTRAEVAEIIVSANLQFLNKSSYQKQLWLIWDTAEINIQPYSANDQDILIDTIDHWSLGDNCDLFGAALRSFLIKSFVMGYLELPETFETQPDPSSLATDNYSISYLDDRYEVRRVSGGYRFQPIGWDGGTFSDVYKTKNEAWYAAYSYDFSEFNLGLAAE